ncbi:MAG: PIN domain-containing protein [Prolixibacteraceae bacterium]|nr:PIN domain-containing protein [Prolixibacteraceae bacterium]
MKVFIDTSAFLALINADDKNHGHAKKIWEKILDEKTDIFVTNYVLIETFAVLQNRAGVDAVRSFEKDLSGVLNVFWVDEEIYREGLTRVFSANRKNLSLVDCVSFSVMNREGIENVFCFDKHFREQGFCVVE